MKTARIPDVVGGKRSRRLCTVRQGDVVRRLVLGLLFWIVFCALPPADATAQTSLTGSNLALKSAGSATLSAPGYLGTYLVIPAGGATVNFTVNATEGPGSTAAPHLNLVVADSTFGISIANTSATNYTTSNVALPAGTYFVRAERDFTNSAVSDHSLTVNTLSVQTFAGSIALLTNTSTDANALAAANTYISNYRQRPAVVRLLGASGSAQVQMTRSAFDFGTIVQGFSNPSNYLGTVS